VSWTRFLVVELNSNSTDACRSRFCSLQPRPPPPPPSLRPAPRASNLNHPPSLTDNGKHAYTHTQNHTQ
jgi:hypothetical protein